MVIFKCCIQAKLTLPRLIICAWDIQNAQDHFLTPSWTGDMSYGSLIFSLRDSKRTTGGLAAYSAPSQLAPIKPMRVGVTKEAVWTILTRWDPSCLLRASVMPDNDGPIAQSHARCTMNLV